MFKWVGKLWDWYQNLDEILPEVTNTQFYRLFVAPFVAAVSTGIAGIVEKESVMWIITAACLCFMSIIQAILNYDVLRERKSPQNKLVFTVVFQFDLNTVDAPVSGNRAQRRVQLAQNAQSKLGPSQLNIDVKRNLEKAQLGVEISNNSSFPIYCILESAVTDVAGEQPPRSTFPKPRVAVPAWSKIRILDDRIDMGGIPCGRISGNLNMFIKYGLLGKERFELNPKGAVVVNMEEFGFISSVILELNGETS